ncbi:hypothetical protein BDN70DRAFT_862090 [Pholiota conissans]|uniref:Uncharacterized protein n=1 Tax=Pholiota conissans TaxID=109636 RepID=A0A9P5YX27_9AGAR|nr:hypothetical protein BDN70DRAFT_862090 [Pholiota conissans]
MPSNKSSIGLDAVTLVSVFVESTLYGLFIALFMASTVLIFRKAKSPRNSLNKPLLFASVSMFILGTTHVGVDLRRTMDAFLQSSDPLTFLGRVNEPIYVAKSTAYAIQTLVGDAFILYRVYLVWNGDRKVVFPILICFIASIGVGIGALQAFARASPDAPVFISDLQNWIVSFFALTLTTNFTSTSESLIAFRIWWVHRRTRGILGSRRTILPAMVVIIESGAIYSACLVILLSLYLSGSFAQYIVLDAVTQVIGVVFSLVIVRVALGISSEGSKTQTKLTTFRVAAELGVKTTDNSDDTGDTLSMNHVSVRKTVDTVENA